MKIGFHGSETQKIHQRKSYGLSSTPWTWHNPVDFFGTSMISPIFPMAILPVQWSPGRSQVIDDAQ